MGKLTRSRILQGGAGLHVAPMGRDRVRKFSTSCRAGRGKAGQGQGKTKPYGLRAKTSSFRPTLKALALGVLNTKYLAFSTPNC